MASKQTSDEDPLEEFSIKKPGTIAVADLEKLLDRRFAVLATAEQKNKMGERISRNENEISEIKGELRQINSKMCSQPPLIRNGNQDHGLERPEAGVSRIGPDREISYNISRRSLRIWPITGETNDQMLESFESFSRDALRVPSVEMSSIQIDRIRRTRSSPNSNTYMEVSVTFRDIDDRDYIASRAVNLGNLVQMDGKPQAGIRMDVPAFLLSTFKDLNGYAFHIRRIHGRKLRRISSLMTCG